MSAVLGSNSVNLTFDPPGSTGSSAVQLYTASCTDGDFTFFASSSTSPVRVGGLTQGVNYSCSVSAINGEIDGPSSAPINVNIPIGVAFAGNADAPQNVQGTAGNSYAQLSFDPPASDGGFPIMGYVASCTGPSSVNVNVLTSPAIVPGLINGKTYNCTVAAINGQGTGANSSSQALTPLASLPQTIKPPGVPTSVSGSAGNGMATLSFVPPADAGGTPINGYSATCTNGSASVRGAALRSPVSVYDLSNGSSYSCTVVAHSNAGSSVPSPAVDVAPNASAVSTAQPTSLLLGTLIPAIAADGLTTVVATLRTSDSRLYAGPALNVQFSSICAAKGLANLPSSASSANGIASVTYHAQGCKGVDVMTAKVAGTSLQASTPIAVSSVAGLSAQASVGKRLFFDTALSASGKVSCASCHAPENNYLAPNELATQPGGQNGSAIGFRSSPKAMYASLAKSFRFLSQTNQQNSVDNSANGKLGTPRGGLMWDGRASDVVAQASGPFTSPHEMANANAAAVLQKLLSRPYLSEFSQVFGSTSSTSNPDTVLANMALAIGQFEREDRSFTPFTSKFDAVKNGQASFTPQEANGQVLFFTGSKAACFGCHTPFSQAKVAQGPGFFTDGAYRVLGAPRNWALPYNMDTTALAELNVLGLGSLANGSALGEPNHSFYDLGFCGPFRTDSLGDSGLCGAFRTPDLRNIALKGSYFHNGVFSNLNQVINFYLNRDTTPQQFYKLPSGSADIPYNDLPVQYQANVVKRAPFTPVPGGRLNALDVQDVVSFLCTLTDGYDPQNPSAYRLPKQCDDATRR